MSIVSGHSSSQNDATQYPESFLLDDDQLDLFTKSRESNSEAGAVAVGSRQPEAGSAATYGSVIPGAGGNTKAEPDHSAQDALQRLAESVRWLKRASDAGVIAGEVEYAIMLFNGEGVAKDEAAAVAILKVAAAKGNPIAQNRLAHLYVDGVVVGRDLARAAAWNAFAKAGGLQDQGLDVATANLTPDERSRFTRIVRGTIGN